MRAVHRSSATVAVCLVAAGLLGGCVAVVPTIPGNVPGYGRTYCLVDEHGGTPPDGLLLLVSTYKDVPENSFGCFPVQGGRTETPRKTDVRYNSVTGGLICLPLVYIGWFQNPNETCVYPLVAGYVPRSFPNDRARGNAPEKDGEVQVAGAAVAEEQEYLMRLWLDFLRVQYHLTPDEAPQWERARNYVLDRFAALERVQPYAAPDKWRDLLPRRDQVVSP
jgi:hypothetical protein